MTSGDERDDALAPRRGPARAGATRPPRRRTARGRCGTRVLRRSIAIARFRDADPAARQRVLDDCARRTARGILAHRALRHRLLRAHDARRRRRRRATHVRADRRGRGAARRRGSRPGSRPGRRSRIPSTASSPGWPKPAIRSRSPTCCRWCSRASASRTTAALAAHCRDAGLADTFCAPGAGRSAAPRSAGWRPSAPTRSPTATAASSTRRRTPSCR